MTVSKKIEQNILERKKGQVLFVSDFTPIIPPINGNLKITSVNKLGAKSELNEVDFIR